MPTVVEWAILGLFGVLAVWMLLVGAGRLRTWNRLRGSATQRVLSPGFVEVEGTARKLDGTVTTPMTDTESLVYEYAVRRRRHDDDGTADWRTVKTDSDSVPFVIETDGGSVVVDSARLDGEDTYLDGDETRQGDRKRTESRLEPGETAYVAGTAVRAGQRDVPTDGQQFVITSDDDSPVPVDLAGLLSEQFICSDGGERAATRRQLKDGVLLILFSIALIVGLVFVAPVP